MLYVHYIADRNILKAIVKNLPLHFEIITSNFSKFFNKTILHICSKPRFNIVDGFVSHIIWKRFSEYELWKTADENDVVENIKEKLQFY